MTSLEDINDPTKAMNAALILFAKAFQISAPTNNNQRTSSNPRNRQLAQPVNQSPSGIFINQSKYVHEILKKYGLNTSDIVGTPMDIKDKLDLDQIRTPVDATKYCNMIGAL
nr:hypothetical protein [Tanacetum cinerariifolium]